MLIHSDQSNSKGPPSPSGADGAASSALSIGLDDGTASPAASLLASEAAALGAYVTVITNTSTKPREDVHRARPVHPGIAFGGVEDPSGFPGRQPRYSYRSTSMGLRREAWIAG